MLRRGIDISISFLDSLIRAQNSFFIFAYSGRGFAYSGRGFAYSGYGFAYSGLFSLIRDDFPQKFAYSGPLAYSGLRWKNTILLFRFVDIEKHSKNSSFKNNREILQLKTL